MNTNIIGIVIAVLVIVGGAWYYTSSQNSKAAAHQVMEDKMMADKMEEEKMMKDKAMDSHEGEVMMDKEEGEEAMMKKDDKMMDDTHSDSDSMEKMDDKMEDKMMDKEEGISMEKPGSFEAYSADKVTNADGKVVLGFFAAWCPTCRALESDITSSLDDIPAGVTILKIDYDNSTDLKKKYGVTTQHTLVQVDNAGNMITTWRGGNTLDSLVSKIN